MSIYYNDKDLYREYFFISILSTILGFILFEIYCYTHAKEWHRYISLGLTGLGFGLCTAILIIAFLRISGAESLRSLTWAGRVLFSLIIGMWIFLIMPSGVLGRLTNTTKRCDCRNVDDCISKYCFEEAREYAAHKGLLRSRSDISFDFAKIIKSEATYWLGEKDVKRAINASNELRSLETIDKPDEEIHTDLGGHDLKKVEGFTIGIKNTYYSELLFNIIKSNIESKEFDSIIILTKMFPEYNETSDDECNKIKSECFIYIVQKLCQSGEIKKANDMADNLPDKVKINTRYYEMALVNGLFTNVAEDDLKAQEVYEEFASKFAEANEEIEPFRGNGKWHKVFKILNLKEKVESIITQNKGTWK